MVLDGMGDARLALLAAATGCAGVVSLHETERVMRLLGALDAEVGRRKATPADRCTWPDIVVLLDGLSAVRARFEQNDDYERLGQLDRIVAEGGAVGVVVVMTATRPGAVPAAMMSHIGVRWVFHLADASDGPLAGVAAAEVPGARPGRLMIAAEGLEAQVCARAVARAAELEELTDLATHRTVPVHEARPAATNERRVGALQGALHSSLQGALRTLPLRVDLGCVPQATASGADWMIPLGLSFETLHPVVLPVAAGEHVLVIGPSRSGRSNAVNALAQQWEQACPRGWSASIAPRRTSARRGHVAADVEALVVALPPTGPALIVIDDAELVDDPSGQLARLIASRREGLLVVAAGRPDALRGAYGHWTAALRRSRLGLVMASCTDLDGDLLGAALPRRPPIPSRAGLAWMVADGGRQLIQVATAAAGPEAREPTDVVDAAFLLDVATSAP